MQLKGDENIDYVGESIRTRLANITFFFYYYNSLKYNRVLISFGTLMVTTNLSHMGLQYMDALMGMYL